MMIRGIFSSREAVWVLGVGCGSPTWWCDGR
jgi:hypothetical protein